MSDYYTKDSDGNFIKVEIQPQETGASPDPGEIVVSTMMTMVSTMKAMEKKIVELSVNEGGSSSDTKLPLFDGSQEKWYAWKKESLSKLNIANCKPQSQDDIDKGVNALSTTRSKRLYDYLNTAVKNSATICKRLGKQSKGCGQTYWNKLVYKFEKEDSQNTAEIRANLISAKIPEHSDMEAFYEFVDASVEKLEDAGETFSKAEMQALHTICFKPDETIQGQYGWLLQQYASQRFMLGATSVLEHNPKVPPEYVRAR